MQVKKYIVAAILLMLVACGIGVRYAIVEPARAAARALESINGLSIGQSEGDLLRRSAFQKMPSRCFQEVCMYSSVQTNTLLSFLHLAPRTILSTAVIVRDGTVVQVYFFLFRNGLDPISVAQTSKMPHGCCVNPCLVPRPKFIKVLNGVSIVFTNDSEYRNRFPEMVDTKCLSRIGGCRSNAEFVPLIQAIDPKNGNP
jgi:hypothetical protein